MLTVQAETDIGLTGGVSLGRGLILIRHNTCWFGEKTSISERRGGVIDERSGHLYSLRPTMQYTFDRTLCSTSILIIIIYKCKLTLK